MIEHKSRAHALLSASSAKRWLTCTPSAHIEDLLPNVETSYSEEGTKAHEIAEMKLRALLDNKNEPVFTDENLQRIEKEVQPYVDEVIEIYNEIKAENETTIMFLETKLDFSDVVPEGFGTGDVIIISDKEINIIDLKFGKGVVVSAEDNPQLRLYALGAIKFFDDLYDFEQITMRIIQPRLNHSSKETLSKDELLQWSDYVKPIAAKAYKGEGEQVAGDHCQFCKARGSCRALAKLSLDLISDEEARPELLSKEELGDVLEKAKTVEIFVKAVREYALSQMLSGDDIPGWKIVEGKSNRKYSNEDDVVERLKENGFNEALIYEKKLYGVTAMEKNIGKKVFNELLNGLIIKPQGAPTIAPVDDKRPVFSPKEKILSGMNIPEGE